METYKDIIKCYRCKIYKNSNLLYKCNESIRIREEIINKNFTYNDSNDWIEDYINSILIRLKQNEKDMFCNLCIIYIIKLLNH
jgi:hypothetical protein